MVSIANVDVRKTQDLITGGRGDALLEVLSQRILAGDSLTLVLQECASAMDVEAVVTSTDGREQAATVTDGTRQALRDDGLIDETGRVRVERIDAEGRVQVVPITAPGRALGQLVVIGKRPAADADVARAATALALTITRDQAVTAVESKYQGDFLRDVFLGRAGSPAFVSDHARGLGWDLDRPSVVLSARIDADLEGGPQPSAEQSRQWQERFAAAWRSVAAAQAPGVPVADFGSEVVAVLPHSDEVESHVDAIVHAVAGDRGGGRRSFSVGVGRPAMTADQLPQSYVQAGRAAEVGRRVHGIGSTTWFDRLGLHRLLALVPDQRELVGFARDVLGELALDTDEARTLRETLQVLLDCNFNVAEAARSQFFHYNTMRYRVGKLERILGPLSRDPHLRLDVAVALRVLEIRG